MGRKLKYKTEDERLDSARKRRLNWYYRNREVVNRKRRQQYYEKKNAMDKKVKSDAQQ